jgi:hypothetical protein
MSTTDTDSMEKGAGDILHEVFNINSAKTVFSKP